MGKRKTRFQGLAAGFSFLLLGGILTLCSMPIFSYTLDELKPVQRSEIVMNYTFDIHQSQDKIMQTLLSTGQKLEIVATGNETYDFYIANFTDTGNAIQPDQPDVTYLYLNATAVVNTTWSPLVRSAQNGSYYLVFLARNASASSPVEIDANVTKNWTEFQTISVLAADRKSLIDQSYSYAGGGILVFGAVILLVSLYPKRKPRSRNRTSSTNAK